MTYGVGASELESYLHRQIQLVSSPIYYYGIQNYLYEWELVCIVSLQLNLSLYDSIVIEYYLHKMEVKGSFSLSDSRLSSDPIFSLIYVQSYTS